MKTRLALFLLVPLSLLGQTPVTVKPSVAQSTLDQTAKDLAVNQKSVNDIFQQFRGSIAANQKQLQDDLTAKQKALEAKLKADKKYGPMLEEINQIVGKLQANNQNAQQELNQKTGPINQKIQSETALMDGLVKVVKQENGLPDAATYDPSKQTWSIPVKAPEKK